MGREEEVVRISVSAAFSELPKDAGVGDFF